MSTLVSRLRAFVTFSLVFISLLASPQVSLGAGPTLPVGPQVTPGPTVPVGPQDPVGVPEDVTVGPQVTPGPQAVSSTATPTPTPGSTSVSNTDTGSNSSNSNGVSHDNSTTATGNNTATIHNSVTAAANTGANTESQNTKAGNLSTGDINGVVNVVNVGNSTFAPGSTVGTQSVNGGNSGQINLDPSTQRSALPSVSATNGTTGANSENSNQVSGNSVTHILQNNDATANNAIAIQANTGNNLIAQNTQAGDLKTGNVNLAINLVNLLNVTDPNLQLQLDLYSVDTTNPDAIIVVPSNSNTGAHSSNSNAVSSNDNRSVQVQQNADTSNVIAVQANTGNNTVSRNSQSGDVATGKVDVQGNVVNLANADEGEFYIVNVFGDWDGTLQGVPAGNYIINRIANDNTGSGSDNSNSVAQNNDSTYTLNNNASANNAINVSADTGHNRLSENTKAGTITTGNVSVYANVINALNSFSSRVGTLKLGIINIFAHKAPVVASAPATPTPAYSGVGGNTDPVPTLSTDSAVTAPVANGQPVVTAPTGSNQGKTVVGYTTGAQTFATPAVLTAAVPPTSTPVTTTPFVSALVSNGRIADPNVAYAAESGAPIAASGRSTAQTAAMVGIPAGLTLLWLGLELAAHKARRRG